MATAARLTFAAVLLPYFVISAATKFGGSSLSMGPDVPGTFLAVGAFTRLAPATAVAVMAGQPPPFGASLFVHAMAMAEMALPLLLVAGLATRWAGAGLIIFIAVITVIDRAGHPEAAVRMDSLFEAYPFDELPDMRLLWAMLVAIPLTLGAGPLSLDAGIGWLQNRAKGPASPG